METYGSAGVAAFLEEENTKKLVYFHSVQYENKDDLQYHIFHFKKDESNKICILLAFEHKNQHDIVGTMDTGCCNCLDIEEEQIRSFFLGMEHVKIKISDNCKRMKIGRGFGHCKFHNHPTRAKGGPYKIPGIKSMSPNLSEEKTYQKICGLGEENASDILKKLTHNHDIISKSIKNEKHMSLS